MTATIINLQQWKAAHPPALILWQTQLECALAWQRLCLSLLFPSR